MLYLCIEKICCLLRIYYTPERALLNRDGGGPSDQTMAVLKNRYRKLGFSHQTNTAAGFIRLSVAIVQP